MRAIFHDTVFFSMLPTRLKTLISFRKSDRRNSKPSETINRFCRTAFVLLCSIALLLINMLSFDSCNSEASANEVGESEKQSLLSKKELLVSPATLHRCPLGKRNSSFANGDIFLSSLNKAMVDRLKVQACSLASDSSYIVLRTESGALAHIVLLDLNSKDYELRPYFVDKLETTSSIAKKSGALAACNAGFFNLSDGVSTSYVVIDGQQVCEPRENKALVENTVLAPFLERIFEREELRILEDSNGKRKAVIEQHQAPVPQGFRLVHSLQGGPQLLPDYMPERGAFVRVESGGKKVDSIGASRQAARTALGLLDDTTLLLVCVEGGRNGREFSRGISLPALLRFLQELGCKSALNFDGGTSSTMVVRFAFSADHPPGKTPSVSAPVVNESDNCRKTVFSSQPERLIKSALIVVPRNSKESSDNK